MELRRYVRQRQPLQVVQLDGGALIVRQLSQGIRHPRQLFLALHLLAGRRLVGHQPRREALRRGVQCLLQRPLAVHVAHGGGQFAHLVGQVVGQDAPQPHGRRSRTLSRLMRLQQGLLHDAGQVDLAAQPRIEVQPGQQVQVGPIALQVVGVGGHALPLKMKA